MFVYPGATQGLVGAGTWAWGDRGIKCESEDSVCLCMNIVRGVLPRLRQHVPGG